MKIRPLFGAAPAEAEPHHREGALDIGVGVEDLLGLLGDGVRVLERRTRRRLHDRDEVALVLVGDERGRHRPPQQEGPAEADGEHHQHRPAPAQRPADHPDVAVGAGVDALVHLGEEPAVLGVALAVEQQRRQRRGEGEGVEYREHDGEGDGQRELLVEPAGGAGEERHRHEHRHQHDADDDDRAQHLLHRIDGGLVGRLAELAHVPLDVLDDDDRVVDDDADGQHDAEQGQRVDREAEQLDEGEGADQRHRDGQRRDDRAAPVLQEQEHHQHDQQQRLAQGLQHLGDRFADHRHLVERQPPLEPGREVLLDPRHRRHHTVVDVERIGRRQQLDPHPRGLEAEETQVGGVVLGAELDPPDVADAHQRAVAAAGDHHFGELGHFGQPSLSPHAQVEHLIGGGRRVAERTGGDLDVLLAQRVDDVAGGEPARRQLAGIEPQPHRVAALAEDDDVADAGHALDGVADVAVEVVADELGVVAVVAREEAQSAHEPRGVLDDGDAVGADVGRHPSQRLVDAVLDVDRRQVGVTVDAEGDRDGAHPAVGARRLEIGHPLHAVDHLFERRGHGRFHRLGVGAGVDRRHRHRGRGQLGKAGDRNRRNGDRAGDHHDHGQHRRENRAADEDVSTHDGGPLRLRRRRGRGRRRRRASGSRRHRGAVADLLHARDDQPVARPTGPW